MDIASVSGYALSSPIEPIQERSFHGGTRRLLKRDFVLVVIETPTGERGYAPAGASSSAMREFFDDDSQSTLASVIEGPVADVLEGVTIDEIASVHELLTETDLPMRLRNQVGSALDVALYDLRGKQAGAPIHELLADRHGTTAETSLPLYASAGMYMEPEGYASQAEILADAGFFGYKYRPGIGPAADRRTIDLLQDVDIETMIDAHTWWKVRTGAYDPETVDSLVEYAGGRGAYWVEEPVDPEAYDRYTELASIGTPLAGGESEESPEGLVELGRTGAVSFLQGDVRHHNGYTGCWEAGAFCAETDVRFVPHNFGTWLGLVANAHLVAALPEASLLEYPVFEGDPALDCERDPGMYPYELAFDVLTTDLAIDDGTLEVPTAPGLGVDVDMSVIEEYPFVEGPWSEFHYDED